MNPFPGIADRFVPPLKFWAPQIARLNKESANGHQWATVLLQIEIDQRQPSL